jgi:hypothetical protein
VMSRSASAQDGLPGGCEMAQDRMLLTHHYPM